MRVIGPGGFDSVWVLDGHEVSGFWVGSIWEFSRARVGC